MPLSLAPVGEELKVIKVSADEKTRRHLENLGLLIGASLTVVSESGGDIIIKLKDGRVGINRSLAAKISVTVM